MSNKNVLAVRAADLEHEVRAQSPLIHQITNFVVMNFSANATLALGSQPVMAHALEEVEQMVGFASALVLNIGTLERAWIESMIVAGRAAKRRGIPIVLDPVGAGATALRTDTARRLLGEVGVSILRGNAGEVMAVAGEAGRVRGVDSLADSDAAVAAAGHLAKSNEITVAVTGVLDVVTDGKRTFEVANGHPMMGRVTGTGCGATVAVACFAAVADLGDLCFAAAAGLARYGLAGEIAARVSTRPGSFAVAFVDALATVDRSEVLAGLRITERS